MGLVFRLQDRLNSSLEKGWFQAPLEFYTSPEKITIGRALSPKELKKKLKKRSIPFEKEDETNVSWQDLDTKDQFVVFFEQEKIHSITKNQEPIPQITLKPFLFAQQEKGALVLKKFTPLSKVPFHCRMAVLAAEDHHFITHGGINLKAILRAIYKNLRAGQLKEGASTITQQLVKNIFFDSKKSFWRKFQEQIMAFLLEMKQDRQNKDQILTAYLNMIYMGQRGMFRVHGLSSASEYYIGKPLSQLNLSECALLAGIIKSPGRYKPSPTNQRIKLRRDHILNTLFKKQKEWMMSISATELAKAKAFPISKPQAFFPPPPDFTDTVYKTIVKMKWPVAKGLKVFTTLYPDFQDKADLSVQAGLKWLKKNRLKKALKQYNLQVALINVEVKTGAIRAVVGGRDFKKSQFNRVVQAQRQIGSLMKPVVLLTALMEDKELHPLSLIEDSPWTYKYDSQSWSPKNYKNQYKGLVPLYQLLTNSLNAGTARLGVKAGVDKIANMIEKLGGPGDVTPHPALILGALELSPWVVSQMFLTLANMGQYKKQHIVKKVTDLNNNVIYKGPVDSDRAVVDPQKVAVVVGMLREVVRSGTARWISTGFPVPVAGKTGTTNEEKDAWFAGFSPEFLTVVWVGFDDNRSHGLTGSVGALPIWESFMRKITPESGRTIDDALISARDSVSEVESASQVDFDWPEGVEEREVKKVLSTAEQEDSASSKKDKAGAGLIPAEPSELKVSLLFEKKAT